MELAQIGDVTDDVSQGEGCLTTTAAIAEQLVYFVEERDGS